MPIRMAIVGFGKIAADQHVPAIEADPRFELAAVASRNLPDKLDVPGVRDVGELIATLRDKVDAVAICTPSSVRHDIARDALAAGLHVMLEKPPAATLGEIEHLDRMARDGKAVLFAAWHSQANEAVDAARELLAGEKMRALSIEWFEDVRKWHPGQDWIFEPSGFGVLDPGINALSIVSRVLPQPLFVRAARLSIPENRQAPIAASVDFGDGMTAEMDFRHSDNEHWTIRIETEAGRTLLLEEGGARLTVDGEERRGLARAEYPGLYDRFARLIEAGTSEVDREPLRLVADIGLVATRERVEAFDW